MTSSRLTSAVLALATMFASNLARADDPSLASLSVALWPEYDRQAMLVIYRVRVAEGTPLPAIVTLPIPAGVGAPHAVARRGDGGVLLVADHTREVKGAWAIIHITTESPEVQLEFYQEIVRDGQQRRFALEWPGTVQVGELSYEAQEPGGATSFTVTPAPGRREVGNDGRTYHFGSVGALKAGQKATIGVTYARSQDTLAAVPPTADTSAAATPPTETQGRTDPMWWILPLSALLLLVSVIFFVRGARGQGGGKPGPSA